MPTLTLVPSCDHLNDTGMALQESCSVKGCVCPRAGGAWTGLLLSGVDTGRPPFSLLPASPSPGWGEAVGLWLTFIWTPAIRNMGVMFT